MPVVELATQRHIEPQAEAADKIFLLVAIVDDRVHHPNGLAAGVEIQAHHERHPSAPMRGMAALDLHHRTHRTILLQYHLADLAGEELGLRAALG